MEKKSYTPENLELLEKYLWSKIKFYIYLIFFCTREKYRIICENILLIFKK